MRSSADSNVRHRPRLGITIGDPAGIGAEIIVKALTHHQIYEWCRPLVIGDTARLRPVAGILGLPIKIKSVSKAADAGYQPNQIEADERSLLAALRYAAELAPRRT